jgi:hypothetical protein
MPALKNQLHEKIALLYPGCTAKGMTQAEIYQMAGGKAGSRQSAEVLASRTLNRPDVLARIAELGAPAAKKAEADAEHFMQKFETVFQGAAKVGQFGHANRAGELQARISGVLVDRSEIKADVHVDDLRDATDSRPRSSNAMAKWLPSPLRTLSSVKLARRQARSSRQWLSRSHAG